MSIIGPRPLTSETCILKQIQKSVISVRPLSGVGSLSLEMKKSYLIVLRIVKFLQKHNSSI